MTIGQTFAAEFQHEQKATREMLAAIPFERGDYKPHEKSMTIVELGSHIAESIQWAEPTLNQDVFVMDMNTYVPYKASSREELLGTFDKGIENFLKTLASYPDEKMFVSWKMQSPEGNVMLEMPRVAVLRSFIMSHMIHHRGQLGVYLRMLDIPLPQVYGPTADNPEMMAGS